MDRESEEKTYKLNRFFALLRPKVLLSVLFFVGIGVLLFRELPQMLALLVIPAIIVISELRHMPKKLIDENGRLTFEMKISERVSRNRTITVSATFIVSNFSYFVIKQNPIEKLFGAGHIEFSGISRENYEKSEGYVTTPDVFKIYGFSSFTEIKNEFAKYIPD